MKVVVTLSDVAIDRIEVFTYTVSVDFPESDGTLQWNSTTLVLLHPHGGNKVGLGSDGLHLPRDWGHRSMA